MEQSRPPEDEKKVAGEAHEGQPGHHDSREHHAPHERKNHPDKHATLRWWLLVATIFVTPALLFFLFLRLRGPRYVTAQWKGMKGLLFGEPTFLIWELASFISVLVGPWLLRRYGRNRKKAIHLLTLILVPLVLVANTWNVASTNRSIVSQRAGEMCEETFTSVSSQLNESARSTSDLVILDQGIAKLMAYVHLIVRSDYPEFELRTASLHMVPLVTHKEKVWNVIQEGTLRKDAEFLDYPDPDPAHTSLVGMAIKEAKTKYCPDIKNQEIRNPEEAAVCQTFQLPPAAEPAFRSLICLPLQTSYSSKVFASLCFDSKATHAFDGKTAQLQERIDVQMNQLISLLQIYRKQDGLIFQDSQAAAPPPDSARAPGKASAGPGVDRRALP